MNLDAIRTMSASDLIGIHSDVDEDAYHCGPGLGRSDLMAMARSVPHFLASKNQRQKSAPALEFGTAVHLYVLEPDRYMAKYSIVDKVDRRTKEYKEMVKDGFTPISQDDHEKILDIADAIHTNKISRSLFTKGKPEQTIYWEDEQTGLLCKCRVDWLREDGLAVDLKTSADASPQSFKKSLCNYNYDVQAAHYLAGLRSVLSQDFKDFLFCVVEKEAPYGVITYRIDEASIDVGEKIRRTMLERYLNFQKEVDQTKNVQPYPEKVLNINLPAFGFDVESRIGDL